MNVMEILGSPHPDPAVTGVPLVHGYFHIIFLRSFVRDTIHNSVTTMQCLYFTSYFCD